MQRVARVRQRQPINLLVSSQKRRRNKKSRNTRRTGTVHTSAKARLTSVAIRTRTRDPVRDQNLIICSRAHCKPFLKISCKSVEKFLRKVANRQTDKQTNNDD